MNLEKFRRLSAGAAFLVVAACDQQPKVAEKPVEPYSAKWYQLTYGSTENQYAAACADFTVNITKAQNRIREIENDDTDTGYYDEKVVNKKIDTDPEVQQLAENAHMASQVEDTLKKEHPQLSYKKCDESRENALKLTGLSSE